MKKFLKSRLFIAIITGIICITGTAYAATKYYAKDVSYTPKDSTWKVDNVEDAINDLYTKAKPKYTGSTTVTPNRTVQTLYTHGTILDKDITIDKIPDTYKNLTTTTTATANDIANGKTVYDSNGNLITGNNLGFSSSTTASTSFNFLSSSTTQTFNLGFQPKYISCLAYRTDTSNGASSYYLTITYNNDYDANNVIRGNQNAPTKVSLNSFFTINTNGITWNITSNAWNGVRIYCTASK